MSFVYAGLFLVAAAVILLEIAFTRVFAIMMWHHLTYMVISVAMLGFGAAGSVLTLRGEGPRADLPARTLSRLASAFGVSVIAAFFVVTRIPLDTLAIWHNKWNFLLLGVLYAILFVPFLLGGFTVGLTLTRLARHVNRLYFFDLLGSAVGGCASAWLLAQLGSSNTVVLAGALAAVAGTVFAGAADRGTRLASLMPAVLGLALAVAMSPAAPWLRLPRLDWPVPYAAGKEFARLDETSDILRLYSSTAEVEVDRSRMLPPIIGGNFGRVDMRAVEGRLVGQDGTAPTMLYKGASRIEDFAFLDDSSAAVGYVARRALGGGPPKVLVIGVGGGVDVMMALAHDAREVTAVELNRAMIEMVTDVFDDYLGGLFRPGAHPYSDRIELLHAEGRSFVHATEDRYDLIQLSGVDSFTALSTGAYTLSESYVYTVEAIKDFYAHLEEGGYIVYSRFIMARSKKPRETLRLANIACTALRELGIPDPASQIAIFRGEGLGRPWASTMIKRGAFTGAEIDALDRFGRKQGFPGLVFDPVGQPGVASAPGVAANRRGTGRSHRRDFSRILRGDDATRSAFEAAYEYDVSAVTDDAPFFFNYYKYSGLLADGGRERLDSGATPLYHPDYPVGHVVLVASLVQISAFGAILILLPLLVMSRRRADLRGAPRVFLYFAALGAGFMLIEITLMQKMVLFLGHPTYAISVVLTSLLGFAGLGSLLAGRIRVVSRGVLVRLLAAVLVGIALNVVGTQVVFPATLGWSFGGRVMLVILLLAPMSLALGMPFPLGIRLVEARWPGLLPWAWAINGFLSVFSSIFCIVLAMAIWFSKVLAVAAVIYGVGMLALASARPEPGEGRRALDSYSK